MGKQSTKSNFEIISKSEIPVKYKNYAGRWVNLLFALSKIKGNEALKVSITNYNEVTNLKKVISRQFPKAVVSFACRKSNFGIDLFISFENNVTVQKGQLKSSAA